MKASQPSATSTSAMSLVEILIVLTILGIFTAIAVQSMGTVTKEAADNSRDRHNAKNLVTVFQSGEAAGLDFYVEGNLPLTVQNVVTGSTSAEGVFGGAQFNMTGLTPQAQADALRYLRLENGSLIYDPDFPGS